MKVKMVKGKKRTKMVKREPIVRMPVTQVIVTDTDTCEESSDCDEPKILCDSPPPSPKRRGVAAPCSTNRRNSFTRSLQAQETETKLDSIVTEQQRQGRQIDDMLTDSVHTKTQLIKLDAETLKITSLETLQTQFDDEIRKIKKDHERRLKRHQDETESQIQRLVNVVMAQNAKIDKFKIEWKLMNAKASKYKAKYADAKKYLPK